MVRKVVRSFIRSFWRGFIENEYVVSLRDRFPRLSAYITRRLTPRGHFGLSFTIATAASLWLFSNIASLANDVFHGYPFVTADVRILNLLVELRSPEAGDIFLFLTHLADPLVLAGIVAAGSIVLWYSGLRRMAIFFAGSAAVGEALVLTLKELVSRTRPEEIYALVAESGHAFPSGHATMSLIVYGMLCFIAIRCTRRRLAQILTVMITGALIAAIGFSRLYLGVHWSSDVLAAWNLGGIVLLMSLALFLETSIMPRFHNEVCTLSTQRRSAAAFLVGLVFSSGFLIYHRANPLRTPPPQPVRQAVVLTPADDLRVVVMSDAFPKYSETLVGEHMEPVSMIMVASRAELEERFAAANWYQADEVSTESFFRMLWAAISGTSYPTAPVTPTFLRAIPEDVAFERPVNINSMKLRHHTRFWKTNYFVGSRPIWVATASFDNGYRYYVTHTISPEIDLERDEIRDNLVATGLVAPPETVQLVRPFMSKNQAGDPFFTDGKAYIFR